MINFDNLKLNKKLILVILVIFLLLILFLLFNLIFIKPQKPSRAEPTPIPPVTFYPILSITPGISEEKIVIKGVTVNNFYKDIISSDDLGNYLIFDSPEYQIAYLSQFEYFQISVNSSPFETEWEEAGKELLKVLGISEQDACRLTVYITTPEFANPEYSGKRYNLSFCVDD